MLIHPSAEEIALASDTCLYQPDSGSTQVSAAEQLRLVANVPDTGRRRCPVPTGWAYMTGSVDGGEVHHGLLGEADPPEVYRTR